MVFFLQTIKTSQSSNLSLYEINKPINYQYLFYVYLNFIAVPFAVTVQYKLLMQHVNIYCVNYCRIIVEQWPKTVNSNYVA